MSRAVRLPLKAFALTLSLTGVLVIGSHGQEQKPSSSAERERQRFNQVTSQSASLREQGNYLASIRVLRREWEERWKNQDSRTADYTRSWGLQTLAESLQAIGLYHEAQQRLLEREEPSPPRAALSAEELAAVRQAPLKDAEQAVLEVAIRRQILIFNETHYQPEHRTFGACLLPRLKKLGFRYLALETRDQAPLDEAMRTGEIRIGTEYYSAEPQRARLLRAALRSGMKIVAFDNWDETVAAKMRLPGADAAQLRETAMARNVDERILQRDPKAKFLVWVGMGHACKGLLARGTASPPLSPMARELWQRTGIEPYSFDQRSDPGSPSAWEGGLYNRFAAASRLPRKPAALMLPAHRSEDPASKTRRRNPVYSGMIESGIDAVILHPADPVEQGVERPRWLCRANRNTIRGTVQMGNQPSAGYLVQALPAGEGDLAAPVDQVTTEPDGRYCLRVPPGRYRMRIWVPATSAEAERMVQTANIRCRRREHLRRDFSFTGKPLHGAARKRAR